MTGEVVSLDAHRTVPLHMMTAGQEKQALAAIKAARRERDGTIDDAYQKFNELIRAYVSANLPVSVIAVAAGLTRQRIYQIRDEK